MSSFQNILPMTNNIANYNKVLSLVHSLMLIKGINDPGELKDYFDDMVEFGRNINWIQDFDDEDEIRRILASISNQGGSVT